MKALPIDQAVVLTIALKELNDAKRQRWFLFFAGAFAVLCLMIGASSYLSAGTVIFGSFARTAASLVNLTLFLIPLMGLLLGALSVSSERERGTLITLLAQPVTGPEILLGKWLGLAAASSSALLIGFGLTGVTLALSGGTEQMDLFAYVFLLTLLLSLSSLSTGVLISCLSRKFSLSVSVALVVWLFFVLVSDLGLMTGAVAFQLPPALLFWISSINPCQIFRLLSLTLLQGNLELLGPAGAYAGDALGPFLIPVLLSLLFLWVLVPLLISLVLSRRWWE
ncbi:MAG: ABC transporter permease [Armatimonadetes bacterium]|nr:ABC transporter permease [Armatimonadota bacterium]MDW8121705.1 ABC transporter permease subunit [Armatimonadota bacterium]